ncbi:hypothetical protein BU16DRAFT_529912 [Lophium mytilinum]|uniref:C2H2-type domain-containing protein n=1 Tax=Lophium mytilinum TaxID=390894 RepID=A0A6A6QIT9_9PEZI|nr:hypothetical protein BU16DRAFT_529912 [Lophium mytilinum]
MSNEHQPLPRGKSVPTYNVKILAGTSLHTPTKYLQKHLPTVSRSAVPSRVSSPLNSQLSTNTMPSEGKTRSRGSSRKPRKVISTFNPSVLSGPPRSVIASSPATKEQSEGLEPTAKRRKIVNELKSVGDLPRASASRVPSEGVSQSDSTEKYRPYGCTVCGKRYTSTYGLENHLQRTPDCINGPQERFHCKLCGKHYKNPAGLMSHHNTAPNCNAGPQVLTDNSAGRKKGEPFRCEICRKAFASNTGLRYHRQFAVTKCRRSEAAGLAVGSDMGKKYRCGSCGKSYKNREGLKYHLRDAAVKCTVSTTTPGHFEPGAFPIAVPEHSTYLRNAFRELTTKTGSEQEQAMAGVQYCLESLDVKIQRVWGGLIKKAEEYDTGTGAEEDKENDPCEDTADLDETEFFSDAEAHDAVMGAQEWTENDDMEDVNGVNSSNPYTNRRARGDDEARAEELNSPTGLLPHWATPRGIFNLLGTMGRKETSDHTSTKPISQGDALRAQADAMHPASRWRIYGGPITTEDPLLRRMKKDESMSSKKRKRSDATLTDSPASKRLDVATPVSPTKEDISTALKPERPCVALEEELDSSKKKLAPAVSDPGTGSRSGWEPWDTTEPDNSAKPEKEDAPSLADSTTQTKTPWLLPEEIDFSPMPVTIPTLVASLSKARKTEFWQDREQIMKEKTERDQTLQLAEANKDSLSSSQSRLRAVGPARHTFASGENIPVKGRNGGKAYNWSGAEYLAWSSMKTRREYGFFHEDFISNWRADQFRLKHPPIADFEASRVYYNAWKAGLSLEEIKAKRMEYETVAARKERGYNLTFEDMEAVGW